VAKDAQTSEAGLSDSRVKTNEVGAECDILLSFEAVQ
jgi:hypothetical protein